MECFHGILRGRRDVEHPTKRWEGEAATDFFTP
jgi:hypothetical protein